MAVEILERWEKRLKKSFFSLMARPLREELFLRVPLDPFECHLEPFHCQLDSLKGILYRFRVFCTLSQ